MKNSKIKKLIYDADFFFERANERVDKCDYISAIHEYFRSLCLEPFNSWTMTEIGNCYRELLLYDSAIEWYKRALAYNKKCYTAAVGAVMCYVGIGKLDIATKYLDYCDGDDVAEMLQNIGDYYPPPEENRQEKSGFRLVSAVNSQKNMLTAKRHLVSGDFDSCAEYLEKIGPGSAEYCEAQYYLAFVYCEKNAIDKALAVSDEMLKVCPDNAKTYIVRIAVCHRLEMESEVNAAVEVLKVIKPDNFVDAMGIAICLCDLEMYEIAARFYEYACDIVPYWINARISLAITYNNIGKTVEAKDIMVMLCKVYPDDCTCRYYAHLIYESKGEKINVKNSFQTVASNEYFGKLFEVINDMDSLYEIEERYDSDDQFFLAVGSLFSSNAFDAIRSAARAFAPSEKLRPLLRQILVRGDVPLSLKSECLGWLLTFDRKREFALLVNDAVEFYRPVAPKQVTDIVVKAVYWRAYAVMRVVGINAEKQLKKGIVDILKNDEESLCDEHTVNENAACLAAMVCGDKPFYEIKEFCDLFGADQDKCLAIAKKWEQMKND